MATTQKTDCPKKQRQKVSFDFKLAIIDQISNGQISLNSACKIYDVSRSSITYWMKKLRSFEQKNKNMGKNDEIKKLKEKIRELEFIKDFQQDIIADFENSTGLEFAKKFMPDALAKQIEIKKRNLSK